MSRPCSLLVFVTGCLVVVYDVLHLVGGSAAVKVCDACSSGLPGAVGWMSCCVVGNP